MYRGERFNGLSALTGAVLALSGATALVVAGSLRGDPWRIVSFSVYGAALVLLYLISTLYHSTRGRTKDVMRKLDHCAIYLLIAGTYTPFTLVTLNGPWGWSLFGVVWALAAIGVAQELWITAKGARPLSLVIYLAMGWVALVAVEPLYRALGPEGFAWVAGGGIVYTAGIVFYIFDERFPYWHGIWHLFVLAGSALHFVAIWRYVA
jgi:hemolysin III